MTEFWRFVGNSSLKGLGKVATLPKMHISYAPELEPPITSADWWMGATGKPALHTGLVTAIFSKLETNVLSLGIAFFTAGKARDARCWHAVPHFSYPDRIFFSRVVGHS
jgi:hypothetical protein